MKTKLLTICLILFTSQVFAEWEKIVVNTKGNSFYIDKSNISRVKNKVYWWDLCNYKKRTDNGAYSFKSHNEGDCDLFRYKSFIQVWHDEKWGKGNIIEKYEDFKEDNMDWTYPKSPGIMYEILTEVCNR